MATKTQRTWQEELGVDCRQRGYSSPVFNIVSDRRGGRTAWSATVTVNTLNIAARYWYDGQYLNNAKEDAAEVACNKLRAPAMSTMSTMEIGDDSEAREEEKIEPVDEPMPEGAIARVGEEILD